MPRRRGVARTQVTLSPPSDLIERVMEASAALEWPMVKVWEISCRRFLDTETMKKVVAKYREQKNGDGK